MSHYISRRRLLHTGAALGGAIGSAALIGTAGAQNAAKQVSKQGAGYGDQPKGEQRCSGCANFIAPSACSVVAGTISPNGWCTLFKAKAA